MYVTFFYKRFSFLVQIKQSRKCLTDKFAPGYFYIHLLKSSFFLHITVDSQLEILETFHSNRSMSL